MNRVKEAIAVVAAIVLALGLAGCRDEGPYPSASVMGGVGTAAEMFVLREPWSFPNSVRFERRLPGDVPCKQKVEYVGDYLFIVTGVVSAQNAFGVRLYYTYAVGIVHHPKTDTKAQWWEKVGNVAIAALR